MFQFLEVYFNLCVCRELPQIFWLNLQCEFVLCLTQNCLYSGHARLGGKISGGHVENDVLDDV